MITEDYCSFEVAKLLRDKGFNWSTQYVYTLDGTGSTPYKIGNWRAKSNIQKPTLQMVMKWLRESHFLFIDIDLLTGNTWTWSVWFMNDPKQKMGESLQTISTYEEAVEAAIKYCLENLI